MLEKTRNIAIIAHVDHGKTTIIDSIFKQSNNFRDSQLSDERIMDNNAIEKERGITIFSKCTSITYNDYTINIIDTPGHADLVAKWSECFVWLIAVCCSLIVLRE